MNIEKIIDENLEVMFWDIYNSRITFLRENDDEYKKLQSKILNIESIENLRDFFTDQKIMSLSEDDSEIILEYIQTLEDGMKKIKKTLKYIPIINQ